MMWSEHGESYLATYQLAWQVLQACVWLMHKLQNMSVTSFVFTSFLGLFF